MHERLCRQIAQYPFDVAGGRQFALDARLVLHLQNRIFDRGIHRHIDREFRADAVFSVFEHAVAETMAGDIIAHAAARQGRGRPELPAFLIAQVKRFAAYIGYRVVAPRCEAEFMRIFAPGVGLAAFRNHAAEMRVRQYVDPRRRGGLASSRRDDVFAAVRGKATQAIEKLQACANGVGSRPGRRRLRRQTRAGRIEFRHAQFGRGAPVDLLGQRPRGIAQDYACHRLQQDAVLARHLIGLTHEYPAGAVDRIAIDA